MSEIIPFNNELYNKCGAFISPFGKIYFVDKDHELFCEEYLSFIKNNNNPIFLKQLELYELWRLYYKKYNQKSLSDFFVMVLSFDKIEKLVFNTITTSNNQPHLRFFNYYLMDWKINYYPKMIYNSNTKSFEEITSIPFITSSKDNEYASEIEDIKKRVLKENRPLFFK